MTANIVLTVTILLPLILVFKLWDHFVKLVNKKGWLLGLMVGVYITAITAQLYWTGILQNFEHLLTDTIVVNLTDPKKNSKKPGSKKGRKSPKNSLIIYALLRSSSIDKAKQPPYSWSFPWRRKTYARIANFLDACGARLIIFNYLFDSKSVYYTSEKPVIKTRDSGEKNKDEKPKAATSQSDQKNESAKSDTKTRAPEPKIAAQKTPAKNTEKLSKQLYPLENDDHHLAQTAQKTGKIVFGYMFDKRITKKRKPRLTPNKTIEQYLLPVKLGNISVHIKRFHKADSPYKEYMGKLKQIGAKNAYNDGDGLFRKMPMLFEFNGHYYASLSLASYIAYQDVNIIKLQGNTLILDDKKVPLDKDGNLRLKFYGPAYSSKSTYDDVDLIDIVTLIDKAHFLYQEYGKKIDKPTFPEKDLYQNYEKYNNYFRALKNRLPKKQQKPFIKKYDVNKGELKVIKADFEDKIVMMIQISPTLLNYRPTPFLNKEAGDHLHVTALDNLIQGDFLSEVPKWYGLVAVIFLSLFTGFLLRKESIILNTLITLLAISLVISAAIYLFFANIVVDIFMMLSAIFLVYLITTFLGYLIIEKENSKNQKLALDNLQKADELKNEFLANTSHELKTPLNGVIGLAEALYDGSLGEINPEQQRHVHSILTSSRRLVKLVNDILNFSIMIQGRIDLSMIPVNVHAITEAVITLSEPLVKQRSKSLQLINSVNKQYPPVNADANRLHEILLNLVDNAIKFTHQGKIEIQANVVDDTMKITVSDTGIGIARNKLNSIFEVFNQADGTIEREYGGTGLGLSICKKLVELHKGKLEVISILDEGSHFSFTLPIFKGKIKQTGINKAISKTPPVNADNIPQIDELILERKTDHEDKEEFAQGKTYTILIVDDDPVNLEVLQSQLSHEDFAVIRAQNGKKALDLIHSNNNINIVLLDVMMPNMSGFEVCEKIRRDFSPDDLPVIFLTVKNQQADIEKGLQVQGNDYITKPFSKQELIYRIKLQLRQADSKSQLKNFNKDLETLLIQRKEELQLHHELVELSPDGIMIIADDKLLQANTAARKLLGAQTIDEIIGRSIFRFFKSESLSKVNDYFQRLRENKVKLTLSDLSLTKMDNTVLDSEITAIFIKHRDNPTFLWILKDNAGQKQSALLRQNIGKIIKHDLKNPISATMQCSEQLLADSLTGTQQQYAALIYQQLQQMLYMVNYAMDLYEMEDDAYVVKLEKIDIIQLFADLDKQLHSIKKIHSVTIDYYLHNLPVNRDDVYLLFAQHDHLQSMFAHLMINAIKLSPANSKISVSLKDDQDMEDLDDDPLNTLKFMVDIHCPGISSANQVKLLPDKKTTMNEELAFGNYSALHIAQSHDGELYLKTDEDGTHIYVILPRKTI